MKSISDASFAVAETPRAQLIAELSELWASALQLPHVEPDENFFDLGGDSMIAIALFAAVEHRFGKAIPLTAIYDAPTVSQLADLLEAAGPPPFSHLVPLKPGKDGPPLFIVHGVGGAVIELGRVAAKMALTGPVYGVQAQGFDGEPPLTDMATMVAQYVAAVRGVAPDGPYLLAGYSFGGLVALEMARTLREGGATIGLLTMIDSYPIVSIWPRVVKLDCAWRQAAQRLGRLWQGGFPAILEYRRERHARKGGGRRSLFPFDPSMPESVWHVQLATEAALVAYRPSVYPGTVDFIAAAQQSPSFPRHPGLMWRALVGTLNIHRVAATHLSMVAEHADRLAAVLTRLVERER